MAVAIRFGLKKLEVSKPFRSIAFRFGSCGCLKEPTFIHRKDKENEFREHQGSYKSSHRATRGSAKRWTQRSTHAVSGSDGEVQSVLVFERSSYSQTVSECWSRGWLPDVAVVRTPSKTGRKGHHDSGSHVPQANRNNRRIKHHGRSS